VLNTKVKEHSIESLGSRKASAITAIYAGPVLRNKRLGRRARTLKEYEYWD